MHSGSCLCGSVTYEIRGEQEPIVVCHCSRCRKANGSAFNAVAPIKTGDMHILTGRDKLAEYESSPGVHRVFCRTCASPLFSRRNNQPEKLRLRLGTLDTPVTGKPSMHIFTAYRAPWHEILDDAPRYAERPGD